MLKNPHEVVLKPSTSVASLAPPASEAEPGEAGITAPSSQALSSTKSGKAAWREGSEENQAESCIVICGGCNSSGNLCDTNAYVLDRAGNFTICGASEFVEGRWGACAAALQSGEEVLIFGGAGGEGNRFSTSYKLNLWEPEPLKDEAEDENANREPGYIEVDLQDGMYKGIMDDGARQGQGRMDFKNGDVYEGAWVEDKMEGKGTMLYADGAKYEGEWVGGLREGFGRMIWSKARSSGVEPDNLTALAEHEGSWKAGKCDGNGFGLFLDGYTYKGNFSGGLAHGKGLLVYPNGAGECSGIFHSGFIKTGNEVFQGVKYSGPFARGERRTHSGNGTLVYMDGSVYEGSFRSGRKNGFGKFTDGKGTVYSGKFVGDKRNGKGTEITAAGLKYVGGWQDDEKSGYGVSTSSNGMEVLEGMWEHGDLLEELPAAAIQ